MKLLVFWLLCISRAAASSDCEDCQPGGVSCIGKSTFVQVCVEPTNCVTEILRVNSTLDVVHVRKNEQASIGYTIVSIDVSNVSVIAIYPNLTNVILGDDERSEQIFNNATKAMEGSYTFIASGTYTNVTGGSQTVCAADDAILYVFTVSISLEKAFYAFKKDTPSTIYVTMESEANDWGRIHLYEYAPISKLQRLDPIDLDKTKNIYTHPYQLSTPINGIYTFKAEEISLYDVDATYSTNASAEVYVLTTDITSDKTAYYSQLGDKVSIPLTITREIAAENITIQVRKPDGGLDNITEITEPLIYNVPNVGESDLGEYKFSAFEIVEGQGSLFSSEFDVEIYTINVTTSLTTDENGRYIAIKGENSTVECNATDSDQQLTWLSADSTAVTNSDDSEVYQYATGGTAILYISDRADFDSSGTFTCSNAAVNISKTISLEGPPERPTLVFMGSTFTCKSNGNPTPSLSWDLGDIPIGDLFQNPTDVSGGFESTSTLSTKTDLFCLGNHSIVCIANNSYSRENTSMPVNDGTATVFFDEYIIFRNKTGNFEYANRTCNGRLLTLTSEDKKSFVTKQAEANGINEFFIGAKKNNQGDWIYPDGSRANLDNEGNDADGFLCAKYSRGDDNPWTSEAWDCNENLTVVCEVKGADDDSPKNLQIEPDECNGTVLTVTWESAADVTAQVTINGTQSPPLLSSASETIYNNLNENTPYKIRVEAIREYCQLYPYVENFATTEGPPNPPKSPKLLSHGTSCKMTWEPGDFDGKTEAFMVTFSPVAATDNQGEFQPESKIYEINATTFEIETPMQPNSKYTATIYSRSCAGNSSKVPANGSCESRSSAPSGSNATVIVLAILFVIIFAGLVFFLFRRWRRPRNRPGFLRFSYAADSANDYDAL